MERFMGCIPMSDIVDYVSNARTWSEALGKDGGMSAGSGCSGTDIYLVCLECISQYFVTHHAFDLKVKCRFATEVDAKKQPFLKAEHEVPMLIADVKEYKEDRVRDLVSGDICLQPWVDAYTGGFVCKAISNQNSQRKNNKGAVSRADSDTGFTFDCMKYFIKKTRPKVSILENVPQMDNEFEDEDEEMTTGTEWVRQQFMMLGFLCITLCFSALTTGSRNQRRRWWCVVIDAPQDKHQMIEKKFRWLFGHFRLDMFPASDFLLGPRELDRLCEGVEAEKTAKKAKKAKSDPDWEPIHEATYSEFGVAWPPPCGPIDKFRDRESEVVFIVDKIWPDERLNVWTFFDANHTLQRCIKYPPHKSPQAKAKAKAKPLSIWEAAKSPWKDYVPTLTAGSSICARCITQSGGEGAAREKVLRRLHALECMAFQGWAPQMYKNKQHPFDSVSHQTLSSMAGNMWNSFAFMPVMLATLGAVNAHTDLAHGEPVADVDGDILDVDNDEEEEDDLLDDEEEGIDAEDRSACLKCVLVVMFVGVLDSWCWGCLSTVVIWF